MTREQLESSYLDLLELVAALYSKAPHPDTYAASIIATALMYRDEILNNKLRSDYDAT